MAKRTPKSYTSDWQKNQSTITGPEHIHRTPNEIIVESPEEESTITTPETLFHRHPEKVCATCEDTESGHTVQECLHEDQASAKKYKHKSYSTKKK